MSPGARRSTLAAVAVLALGLAIALSACGGGDDSTSSANGESTGAGASGEASGASVSAAREAVAPYTEGPTPFPVTESLKEVPKGAVIAFADCGSPGCGLFWELIHGAAETMGVEATRIKAGSSASTVSAAFDTIVAQKPDAVIVAGIRIELWSQQLQELQQDDIPVVTVGVNDAEEYGIESPQAAESSNEREGKLLANYVVGEMGSGEESNVVFYDVPEISYTGFLGEVFTEELEAICSTCSVRTVHIPASTIGNTAPTRVVSDLQANPDTNVAVFANDETQSGLPAALDTAGIEIETLGNGPQPTNLQYLKEGEETAALAFDLPVTSWTLVDQAAREIIGQELSGQEAKGLPVTQFLTQEDITFDPSNGWTGYPDFAKRFATLWGVGG